MNEELDAHTDYDLAIGDAARRDIEAWYKRRDAQRKWIGCALLMGLGVLVTRFA